MENSNITNNQNEITPSTSKGLFYGVIGVATLIVAIIGATFAWFTATANYGESNRDISVTSGQVVINYTNGNIVNTADLFPIDEVELTSTIYDTNNCTKTKEGNTYNVCALKTFTVTNGGTIDSSITVNMDVTSNEFTNLKYKVLDSNNNLLTSTTALTGTGTKLLHTTTLNKVGGTTPSKNYKVLIWLEDIGTAQDEQNKSFAASINIVVSSSGYVTGSDNPSAL